MRPQDTTLNWLTADRANLPFIRLWLEAQGLPQKNIAQATPYSLAMAFTYPEYLAMWKSRINQ